MKKVSLCRMVSSVALSIGSVNVYLYASDTDSMRVDAQDETFMGTAVKTPVHKSLGRVNNNQKTWTIGGKIGLGGSIALLALGGLCLCFIATPIGCVMSILMIAFGVILMPVSFQFGRRDIPVNNAAVAPESVLLRHDARGAHAQMSEPSYAAEGAGVAHAPMPEPSYAAEGEDVAHAYAEAAQQGDLSYAAEGAGVAHACAEAAQQGDLSYAAEGKDMARACVEAAQKGDLPSILKIYESNCPIDYQGNMTALMFAVINNHAGCVEFLVDKEAGKQDVGGWTALIYAVYHRRVDFVTQQLIEEEYHLKAYNGTTALSMAKTIYRWDRDGASYKILKRLQEYAAPKGDPAISDAASNNISPADTHDPMSEPLESAASDEQGHEKHTEPLSDAIYVSSAQPQSSPETASDARSARIDGVHKLLEYVNADQLPENRDIEAFEQPQSNTATAPDDRSARIDGVHKLLAPVSLKPSPKTSVEQPQSNPAPAPDARSARIDGMHKLREYVNADQLHENRDIKAFEQPQSSPETASDDRSASTPNEMEVQDDSTEPLSDDIDVPPLDNTLFSLLDEETPPVSLKPSQKTSVEQPQSNPAPAPDARSARIDVGDKLLEYVNADQLPANRDIEALLAAAEKAHSRREDIYTALCIAAARIGDEDMLQSLSAYQKRIACDKNAKTALMWLAEKQPHLLLQILKELQGERQWVQGNDVVIEDEMFNAKLQSRDFKLYAESNLSYLMQAAHDKVDDNGMNALMYAVKSGNLALVKLLLAASMYEYMSSSGYYDALSSPFLTKNCFSRTVFAYATDKDVFQFLYEAMNNSVKKMQTQCAEYQKALVALTEAQAAEGQLDQLRWSLKESEYEEAIAAYDKLAQNFEEVLPYQKDGDGHTLMIYAARSRNRDIVNALRKKKQVTSLMACLYTDLMLACMGGDVDSAQQLLSEAQKVDQKDRTALMYAAMFGQVACVKLLLEKTAEAKLQDKCGMTALMHAAAHGHQDCVKLLLEHECGFKDYFDNTALCHALQNGHLECVDLLFNKEEDKTQLSSIFLQAILSGNVQIVDKILEKKDIVEGALGNDPVNACLLLGRFIQQVMAKGYDDVAVSLWQCMQEYKTALENITAETKDAKMAIRLSSMTPLMYAAQVGNEACISRFIAQGGQKDAEGNTALMYAVRSGDINIVQKSINWLLEAEAGIQDNDGKTALMYYVEKYSYYPAQVRSVLEAFVLSKDAGKTAKGESAWHLLVNKLSLCYTDNVLTIKGESAWHLLVNKLSLCYTDNVLTMLQDFLDFDSDETKKGDLEQALDTLQSSEVTDECNAQERKSVRDAACEFLKEKLKELEGN